MRPRRAVDAAMDEERPEKQAMRQFWIAEVVAAHETQPDASPLYTTLPGARGRELELLEERGVIVRTETGAIETPYLGKVFAIESERGAIAELQSRFPGLKILRESIENILKVTTPLRWPEGEPLEACRAPLLNLDLNTSLGCRIHNNQL